ALLSLRIAAVTMVLATELGTAAAIGLTRGRFRGRRALEFFFVSPMVVPSIVLAIGLYLLFARFKLVGQPLALYLAHTVVAAPLVIVIVSAALKTTDPAIELAARSLGAGYFRTLWHVTLPAILPAVVSGAAFAFLVSFDEVVLAIFLGGPATTTLPKRMWESVRFEIDPTLTAISTGSGPLSGPGVCTIACTALPYSSSGRPITHDEVTLGCSSSAASTSAGYTFAPPTRIMSVSRSLR